jgi:hypothetical protein
MENDPALVRLCEQYGFENPIVVKEIIKAGFKRFGPKPTAFVLIKALNIARTYLKTEHLKLIKEWAKS